MNEVSIAAALSLGAVAYNNVINRWGLFHSAVYVPVNLVFAGLITLASMVSLDMSATRFGFEGAPSDVALGLVPVAVVAFVMFAIASSRHGHRITDARVEGMRGRTLVFYALVRIPLGTAVTEEVVFRGVLLAAWRDVGMSTVVAAWCASIAFGLWHISPTIIGVRMNDPDASAAKMRAAVVGAVLFTTVVGLGLCWLRVWSGGLLSPIVVHAGVNSVSAIAAVRAGRRRIRGSGSRSPDRHSGRKDPSATR